MKHNGRYLKGARNKVNITKPSKDLQVECYVDADVSGLRHYKVDIDPISVKRRTVFLFILGGFIIS